MTTTTTLHATKRNETTVFSKIEAIILLNLGVEPLRRAERGDRGTHRLPLFAGGRGTGACSAWWY